MAVSHLKSLGVVGFAVAAVLTPSAAFANDFSTTYTGVTTASYLDSQNRVTVSGDFAYLIRPNGDYVRVTAGVRYFPEMQEDQRIGLQACKDVPRGCTAAVYGFS